MAHRTVRCTPDSPVPLPRQSCRWILAVGASDLWARLGVRCTPDMHCLMSGAPAWACLTSARAARAFNVPQGAVAPLAHRTVRCTPDSPVNYSAPASKNSRGRRVESESPGAPDRYCSLSGGTPDSPVRQTRAASVPFAVFYLNPFLDFLLVCVEPFAPVKLII